MAVPSIEPPNRLGVFRKSTIHGDVWSCRLTFAVFYRLHKLRRILDVHLEWLTPERVVTSPWVTSIRDQ